MVDFFYNGKILLANRVKTPPDGTRRNLNRLRYKSLTMTTKSFKRASVR